VLGDFDLAEDSVQDAFVVALERWPVQGVPDNPGAWITTTARNKAIDRVRRAEGVETACPAFSFGVAQCPHEATEFDKLVQLADTRLYEAKQAKR